MKTSLSMYVQTCIVCIVPNFQMPYLVSKMLQNVSKMYSTLFKISTKFRSKMKTSLNTNKHALCIVQHFEIPYLESQTETNEINLPRVVFLIFVVI